MLKQLTIDIDRLSFIILYHIILHYLVGGLEKVFFPIIYGTILPIWLIFSEGFKSPTRYYIMHDHPWPQWFRLQVSATNGPFDDCPAQLPGCRSCSEYTGGWLQWLRWLVKMNSWLWKQWPSDVFDDLPIKSGDFNSFNSYVSVPEGRYKDVENSNHLP